MRFSYMHTGVRCCWSGFLRFEWSCQDPPKTGLLRVRCASSAPPPAVKEYIPVVVFSQQHVHTHWRPKIWVCQVQTFKCFHWLMESIGLTGMSLVTLDNTNASSSGFACPFRAREIPKNSLRRVCALHSLLQSRLLGNCLYVAEA